MKAPFLWDPYSDQPYQLKDRAFKKAMRKKELFSLLSTFLSALLVLPVALLAQIVIPKRRILSDSFFGMSVNLDKEPQAVNTLTDELELSTLLIRFPLWEMERLESYVDFVKVNEGRKIILNVMQDREHVEDLALLKSDLESVFQAFSPYVDCFQIGSTINRAKWGFFSVREYLRFYEVAYELKRRRFPALRLLGPSVIDFEYHFTAHALFNFFTVRYDAVTALLYVDRRGAPENTQMGFDLIKKIGLLDALALMSPKASRSLYITETNWPISNTAPYAPTSEYECVDEESYADFMVRYYLLAFASQKVDAVYWHQLIAPGYGLVDNREGLRKRTAFNAFKTMQRSLKEMEFVSFEKKHGIFTLVAKNIIQTTTVKWSLDFQTLTYNTPQPYLDRDGNTRESQILKIGPSPIYLIEKSD
ncbi:glycosyl hydrolase [Sulfurimonas sp. HSL3-7]|uniref:glycosyl hydrolase n=1 Tax=Sulfonitrofixus jiaomeiensis TaxID=3131938 RepID=UPI0031F7DBA6